MSRMDVTRAIDRIVEDIEFFVSDDQRKRSVQKHMDDITIDMSSLDFCTRVVERVLDMPDDGVAYVLTLLICAHARLLAPGLEEEKLLAFVTESIHPKPGDGHDNAL